MYTILSLVTSVKDYIEIAHKLVETQAYSSLQSNPADGSTLLDGIKNYTEYGSVLTFVILSIKEFLTNFFSLSWLKNIWSYPLIVPDIASAMISEISVYDSYFTNAFSFLENGLNLSNNNSNLATVGQNPVLYGFEKFMIGFLNSIFLVLPTSTSHLITIRRFVMQGLEAGYMAGLGTIAGNLLWISSIILGWRFIVIPWLSLDVFRYVLGFILLLKYLWDSSKELNKTGTTGTLEDSAKTKIFVLNFLLALTEQTSIYPFISNISFGAEGSILEGFYGSGLQTDNLLQFYAIHGCYLIGILLGSFSLLQFTVWFWENPAFSIYMWMVSSYKVSTSSYYKVLNFIFLYLTMFCAISSIPYFGLDYTITNPLGLIPQDRILYQKSSSSAGDKILQETSFLGVSPTDKNSRIRDGVHARRERWKERLVKYQAFDASLYDQGTYDILTIEDLNYGFDRFWLRRKLRNHQIRFRLFPGPWMRSLKKQLNKPGFTGPRVEFFRILFEQYYHPCFHASNAPKGFSGGFAKQNYGPGLKNKKPLPVGTNLTPKSLAVSASTDINNYDTKSLYALQTNLKKPSGVQNKFKTIKDYINTHQYSALRKFSRYYSNRINTASLANPSYSSLVLINNLEKNNNNGTIYSKSLKSLFKRIYSESSKEKLNIFRNISKNLLMPNPGVDNKANRYIFNSKTPAWQQSDNNLSVAGIFSAKQAKNTVSNTNIKDAFLGFKNTNIRKKLSKKERLLLMYKAGLPANISTSTVDPNKTSNVGLGESDALKANVNQNNSIFSQTSVLQPLNFYFQKDEAFKRKLKYYSTTVTRNYTVGNNAPYLKTMLKRAFFYYKPSLRLKRTLFTAAMRRGFRKKSVSPKKLIYPVNSINTTVTPNNISNNLENHTNVANIIDTTKDGPIISRSTTSYSVLGKRASRYRYQIYKDVLQHWYYTPFNRLLLKFDIDSFINRQPKTHFNTAKEERLLHYRRMLLSEHYNTLRWYTYMQHYRTMKARIGGTKSFANTVYNQQFQGSFKKIRHLFAVTPSQGDMSVLKFDQVLFNDGFKPLSGNGQLLKPLNPSSINKVEATGNSEKLSVLPAGKTLSFADIKSIQDLPQDFIDQSLSLTGEIVKSEQQLKNLKIKEYITNKNYSAISNPSGDYQTNNSTLNSDSITAGPNQILFQLLKECKRRLNDQTFLKNYTSHRIDKREQRNMETAKELKNSLEYLKAWLSPISINNTAEINNPVVKDNSYTLTTGLSKALNEGVYALNNINPAISSKTLLLSQTNPLKFKNYKGLKTDTLVKQYNNTLSLETLNSIKNLTEKVKGIPQKDGLADLSQYKSNKTLWGQLVNKDLNLTITAKTIATIKNSINTVLKPVYYLQNILLAKRSEKNLEWWRQKQRAMGRIQASRKKGRFKTIQTTVAEQQQRPLVDSTATAKSFQSSSILNTNDYDLQTIPKSYSKNYYSSAFKSSPAGQDQLRRKVDYTDQKSDNNNLTSTKPWSYLKEKVLEKFFVKKFRKKPSSKGRRFRVFTSSSSARGFAYIKKPKKANGDLSIIDLNGNALPAKWEADANENVKNQGLLLLGRSNFNLALLKDVKEALVSKTTKAILQSWGTSQTLSSTDNGSNASVLTSNKVKNLKDLLIQTNIKKSPIKKNTLAKRTFKRRKRHKFTRNLQKYRKRQLQGLGKYRKYSKKLQRIKSSLELRNWWWNNYLPTIVKRTRVYTNLVNNSSYTTKPNNPQSVSSSYKPLSTSKALEIANKSRSSSNLFSSAEYALQTNDIEPQVLSTNPQNAILNSPSLLATAKTVQSFLPVGDISNIGNALKETNTLSADSKMDKPTLVDQIILDLFTNNQNPLNTDGEDRGVNVNLLKNAYTTTNIPFYAGWDESLRKFVVTNRLLSRRDAGFFSSAKVSSNSNPTDKVQFSKAPIQGLNEGSFLYLQNASDSGQILPFNAYTIDQFIPNNQSFYAPLGWKRFQFRHSLLKNWYTDIGYSNNSTNTLFKSQALNLYPIFLKPYSFNSLEFFNSKTNNVQYFVPLSNQSGNSKNMKALQNRRIKKRYKLLKQTPIQLMYLPTGTLLTEVLPSHYISVFDKQYRFPRNRYLKRNLLKSSGIFSKAKNMDPQSALTKQNINTNSLDQNPLYTKDLTVLEYSNFKTAHFSSAKDGKHKLVLSSNLQNPEFSLRKRIKPRRKYHKKRFYKKDSFGLIFPRRHKFGTALINNSQNGSLTVAQTNAGLSSLDNNMDQNQNFRLRPSSTTKQTGINKNKSKKRAPKANPVRLRQLRRREFQQVYKPLQRFQPRYGGFVWPGDYLRLDVIPMPKLQSLKSLYNSSNSNSNSVGLEQGSTNSAISNKVKSGTKINVQPVGLLPRKYLIQKHNIKVLKKKYALSLKV
jgi:hypothetical protein